MNLKQTLKEFNRNHGDGSCGFLLGTMRRRPVWLWGGSRGFLLRKKRWGPVIIPMCKESFNSYIG
jgi:hypothetical protein